MSKGNTISFYKDPFGEIHAKGYKISDLFVLHIIRNQRIAITIFKLYTVKIPRSFNLVINFYPIHSVGRHAELASYTSHEFSTSILYFLLIL